MSCSKNSGKPAMTVQAMVDQGPRYERQVLSRKHGVYRPDLRQRKKKVKWL